MAHPEGEVAAARAAQVAGTVFILSTISTSSIEAVAEAAPVAIKWFQLYIYKDREVEIERLPACSDPFVYYAGLLRSPRTWSSVLKPQGSRLWC